MVIKLWGTRGSIPVPGETTIKYGGNTPCVSVIDNEDLLIIDAGTGIRELGKTINGSNKCGNIKILISHTHWDHIQGLPFFKPIYNPGCKMKIYSDAKLGSSIDQIFETQWDPNYFPVTADLFGEKIKYEKIESGNSYNLNGFEVDTLQTHHSQGTLSFRLRKKGKTIVYMTDNEINYDAGEDCEDFEKIEELNSDLINFCRHADYLIHDSMYTLKDYKDKIGWGHSNNISLAHFAIAANVKNLVLFHYEPEYNDEDIDRLFVETRKVFDASDKNINCIASYDGLELEV